MTRIIVCDDSLQALGHIGRLLKEWLEKKRLTDVTVEKYSDADRLYRKIEAGDIGDIYILDILMGEKSGIDIGRLLKEKNKDTAIIFTTASTEYALEAYQVFAQRYLLKPVSGQELEEALSYVMSVTALKAEKQMAFNTAEGVLSLPFHDIIWAECAARKVYLHLSDGRVLQSIFIRNSFEEELSELLSDSRFLQIHKSFIVNMSHVAVFGQDYVVMSDKERLPVSKKRIAAVKRIYLQYAADRCRYVCGGG